MFTFLLLVGGLLLLSAGAELLVRGASSLAVAARVSPLVVGLTVVAYGTSTPELVVSVQASLRGQSDIALGNVVGSNIFNVLFILGISALIVPLNVSRQLVRFDVPLMIGVSVLVAFLALDGEIGFADGLMLALGLVAYTAWGVYQGRKEQLALEAVSPGEKRKDAPRFSVSGLLLNIGLIVIGLGLLLLGSRWFSDGAIVIAQRLGLSELVIGLTIVAAGTSLPEVATSIMAALRGQRDIAVGNVVGSNLFNILGVLGLSGVFSLGGVPVSTAALQFDIPVMIAVAFACLPIFFTGHLIARWEGGLFLAYFFAYTAYLILAAVNPAVNRTFGAIMLGFVAPLTVITLAVSVFRSLRLTSVSGSE